MYCLLFIQFSVQPIFYLTEKKLVSIWKVNILPVPSDLCASTIVSCYEYDGEREKHFFTEYSPYGVYGIGSMFPSTSVTVFTKNEKFSPDCLHQVNILKSMCTIAVVIKYLKRNGRPTKQKVNTLVK